jgi:hypothetical protein
VVAGSLALRDAAAAPERLLAAFLLQQAGREQAEKAGAAVVQRHESGSENPTAC